MGIFYWEKAFHAGKKIWKNDFAPSKIFLLRPCYDFYHHVKHNDWICGQVENVADNSKYQTGCLVDNKYFF